VRYKENLEDAQRRIIAWANRDPVDRPALVVTAPRDAAGVTPMPPPGSLEQRWLDIDYRLEAESRRIASTWFGGESVPYIFINLGPGVLAAFLTGRLRLAPDTVWFPRAVDRLEDILDLRLSEQNPYWRFVQDLTRGSVEAGRDSWYTSITDIGGVSDVAAGLRGNAAFLMDTLSEEALVQRVLEHLCDLWLEVYDRLDAVTSAAQDASASWLLGYAPRRQYPLQSDVSAMLSPRGFVQFVVPELRRLARRLELPVYHLDGPDAVKHLDALLDVPEIRAIQWVPGAGTPHAVEWLDLLRGVQRRGKALYVYAHTPAEVETLARELRPEGLMIDYRADREETGRAVLRSLAAWCRRGSKG